MTIGARMIGVAAACWIAAGVLPAGAETVMQQCGGQYQAAKAAGTLNGMTWNQYRTDCATRLKATPAVATAPATPAAEATAPANPLKPIPATPAVTPAPATTAAAPPAPPAASPAPATQQAGTAKPMSAGRTAFVARERQCGTEWKANKPTLIAQTPGLTWPKYLSQCNAKLKAAGQ